MEWKEIHRSSDGRSSTYSAESGNLSLLVYPHGSWNAGYDGYLPCYRFSIHIDGVELYKPKISTGSEEVAMSAAESFATMWHEVIGGRFISDGNCVGVPSINDDSSMSPHAPSVQ